MYKIGSGIPRPAGKQIGGQPNKYPLGQMQVNDHIIIPQTEKLPGDDDRKFRNRINQAVRTYKQRQNNDAVLKPGYNAETFVPLDFTVLTLGEPPQEHAGAWQAGDVGIWRDS